MDVKSFMFLAKFVIASSLIPFVLGLIRFSRRSLILKLLTIVSGVSFFCDATNLLFPGNYFGNIYRLVEFGALVTIYYLAFNKRSLKGLFISGGLLFVIFFLSNLLFLQRDTINTYTDTLSALFFIVLSICYFYFLMKGLPAEKIYLLPMFWINIGVLVYFAGNLFLFSISQYILNVLKTDFYIYWMFHNALLLIKNLLFAFALLPNLGLPNPGMPESLSKT
jgi:hypothetical protein